MRSWKTIHFTAAALSVAALGGCQNNDGGGGGGVGAGNPKPTVQASPDPNPSKSTRLKRGAAPLQFMLAGGGNVRVVDSTTGKQVAKTKAKPHTLIRVDPQSGIHANDQQLAKGPLPEDHQYEIWMDR